MVWEASRDLGKLMLMYGFSRPPEVTNRISQEMANHTVALARGIGQEVANHMS